MQILKTEKLYEFYSDPLVLLSIKVLVHNINKFWRKFHNFVCLFKYLMALYSI